MARTVFKWMTVVGVVTTFSLLQIAGSMARPYFPFNSPRPDPTDAPVFARWLAAQATWGVVSTFSARLKGAPWGNVQSFADGYPGNGTGTPYFYLSDLDATALDVLLNERASFTVSEETLGTCKDDPEMPTCAKVTFSGILHELTKDDGEETTFAISAIIAKHPVFKNLPSDHHFHAYKLELKDIWLVDTFGGANIIEPAKYYSNK